MNYLKVLMPVLMIVVFTTNQYAQLPLSTATPIKIEARKWVKDKPNQPWAMFDTEIIDSLKYFKPTLVPTNCYGSWIDKKFHASGFFRVQKVKNRWWFVDPQGFLNIQRDVNGLRQGPSEHNIAAFSSIYGNSENWIKKTFEQFNQLGFNGIGAWSDTEAIVAGNNQSTTKFSYSLMLSFMSGYGKKRGGTYQLPGNTGYPNQCIFVFDPNFEKFCDEYAKTVTQYKNDPNLIGYFSDNELPFGIKNLDGYLNLSNPEDPGRIFAQNWIKVKRLNPSDLTDAIKEEFAGVVADYYYRLVSTYIHKYDPNHLYLGSRLHGAPKNSEAIVKAAGKYCDVVSINYYGDWTPNANRMKEWDTWANKPFIITEFYTKAMDSGLANTTGAGFTVHTQLDRGYAYQHFCLGLLKSTNCIGWHWFKYQDNDPEAKGVDPSNVDSNKGMLNTAYQWYTPLTNCMKQLNNNVYTLINYFDNSILNTSVSQKK